MSFWFGVTPVVAFWWLLKLKEQEAGAADGWLTPLSLNIDSGFLPGQLWASSQHGGFRAARLLAWDLVWWFQLTRWKQHYFMTWPWKSCCIISVTLLGYWWIRNLPSFKGRRLKSPPLSGRSVKVTFCEENIGNIICHSDPLQCHCYTHLGPFGCSGNGLAWIDYSFLGILLHSGSLSYPSLVSWTGLPLRKI